MTKDLTDTIIDNTAFNMMPSRVPSDLPRRLRFHIQRYTDTKEDQKLMIIMMITKIIMMTMINRILLMINRSTVSL